MGKLVEHELLTVQHGVTAGMEHEVFGVGGDQGRAETVVGVEVCEFDDAKPPVPPVLDGVAEVVEGEGAAELKARDGRRYTVCSMFTVRPLSVGSRTGGGSVSRGTGQCSGMCVISSSRNLVMAWRAFGEMSPRVRAA